MDTARLASMANQIARNFAAMGQDAAIEETARHIRLYWDPRMREGLRAADPASLSPIAQAALARLAD